MNLCFQMIIFKWCNRWLDILIWVAYYNFSLAYIYETYSYFRHWLTDFFIYEKFLIEFQVRKCWVVVYSLTFQFSSVAQSCPTLCDPMNCSMPGLLPITNSESTQTHVHRVSDAIQPSHPLSSLFPPALNLSQHQGLFKWVSFLL